MKHHGKATALNSAILKFLDSVYQEISTIEHEYEMQTGGSDLRVPIEYYQDVIRLLTAHPHLHHSRLSTESLSADLSRLRRLTEWIGSGSHVFLQNYNPEEARKLKRALLVHSEKLDIQSADAFRELMEFATINKPHGGFEKLQEALNSRVAEKQIHDSYDHIKFTPYPAREFWEKLESALREFADVERSYESTLEFKAGNKTIKKIKAHKPENDEVILLKVTDTLKHFWVQIIHPALLAKCVSGKSEDFQHHPPKFNPSEFVNELKWQQMERDSKALAELYTSYTVLFAAAVKDAVDHDFKELVDSMDGVVAEASDIKQLIQELLKQDALELEDIEQIVEQCQNEEIKKQIMVVLHKMQQQKQQKKQVEVEGEKIIQQMDEMMRHADNRIKEADKAHFNFLASQLMVYQSSQEMVKKMAMQGLNLAGKFVEQAAADVSRGPRTRSR